MNKIRILFMIASSDIGGAEGFIYTLLTSLDDERYEKYVVCPDKGYYTDRYSRSVKMALLIDPRRSFMNPATILKAANFMKENDIDITHTMLYTSDFCGIWARRLSGGKSRIVNTINGFNFLIPKRGRLNIKRGIASLVYRFIYRYTDRIVAVSEAVRLDLVTRPGIRVEAGKIATILAAGVEKGYDNFSSVEIDRIRNGFLGKDDLAISAVGTFNEFKDYGTMVDAFSIAAKRDSRLKFLIAGDGPERPRMVEKTRGLGLNGRIRFLGSINSKEKNALLSISDILAMSSKSEGCPTVLFEAMYFGKPVVATAVGGIPEIVEDGVTGTLVSPSSPDAMADALLDLAKDGEKRLRFGKRAKEIFAERFTQAKMLAAYCKIYDDLLSPPILTRLDWNRGEQDERKENDSDRRGRIYRFASR